MLTYADTTFEKRRQGSERAQVVGRVARKHIGEHMLPMARSVSTSKASKEAALLALLAHAHGRAHAADAAKRQYQ
jgi:hypothetical protein